MFMSVDLIFSGVDRYKSASLLLFRLALLFSSSLSVFNVLQSELPQSFLDNPIISKKEQENPQSILHSYDISEVLTANRCQYPTLILNFFSFDFSFYRVVRYYQQFSFIHLKNMNIFLLVLVFLSQASAFLFDNQPKQIATTDIVTYIPPIASYSVTHQIFNSQKQDRFAPKIKSDHFIQHSSQTVHPQLKSQPNPTPIIQNPANANQSKTLTTQQKAVSVEQVKQVKWSLQQIKVTARDNLFLIVFIVGFFSVLFLRSRKQPQNVAIRLPDSQILTSQATQPDFETQV